MKKFGILLSLLIVFSLVGFSASDAFAKDSKKAETKTETAKTSKTKTKSTETEQKAVPKSESKSVSKENKKELKKMTKPTYVITVTQGDKEMGKITLQTMPRSCSQNMLLTSTAWLLRNSSTELHSTE